MSELTELGRTVEYIKGKLDVIAEAVLGDPSDEQKPGIRIRLDRLERSNALTKRVLQAVIGCLSVVVGSIVAAVILRAI